MVRSFNRALAEWARSDGLTWAFVCKALLTAFLALWLAYRLELPQPGTVLVTVFIVMQPQSGQVLAKSFYRIIGTLLGLSVMVLLIALFNQERVLFMLCLAIWIGLCTAGAARYRDFRGYACVLAGYTAVMIGLPATTHPDDAFMLALWRVLEISLGILCTGLVNGLILPQTTSADLRNTLHGRFRDFAAFACEGLAGGLDTARFDASGTMVLDPSRARMATRLVSTSIPAPGSKASFTTIRSSSFRSSFCRPLARASPVSSAKPTMTLPDRRASRVALRMSAVGSSGMASAPSLRGRLEALISAGR